MASESASSQWDESVNLEALTYRSLQLIAQDLQLPGTLKKPVMVTMLQAKRAGDEEMVRKIIEENRRYRSPKQPPAKDDKKATVATKRKGPGRPRREETPDSVPEKRAKGAHPSAARGQDAKSGRMSTAQLHSTQPLLRALLDTTPPIDYLQANASQPNLSFFNRPQSLPANLQSASMFHSTYSAEQNPNFQYALPPNTQNGNRYHGDAGPRDNFPHQSYHSNLNDAGLNDSHAGSFNGLTMPRIVPSAEFILPEIVTFDEESRPEQPRAKQEIPLNYSHRLFKGTSEMCASMINVNLAGQEAWNGCNRLQFLNSQEHSSMKSLFTMSKRHFFQPVSTKSTFKDTGGFFATNINGRERMDIGNSIVYHNLNRGFNQVYDLSVPKPNSSQNPATHPPYNTNYFPHLIPPCVGPSQDAAYTQTNNNTQVQQIPQGQQGQQIPFAYEPERQTFPTLVNTRPLPPAYQSPQSLRGNQESSENSSQTLCSSGELRFTPSEKVPQCLEYLLNLRRDRSMAPEASNARYQQENTATTTTDFYTFPLTATRAHAPCSGSEATESCAEDLEGYDTELDAGRRPSNDVEGSTIPNLWSGTQTPEATHLADRNQYSLPMIYDYLGPELVGEQFQNIASTASESVLSPIPTNAISIPTVNAHSNPHVLELSPLQPGHPSVESSALASIGHPAGRHYIGDTGLINCRYAVHGCQQTYPAQQAHFHEQGCLHMMLHCPMNNCTWTGKLGRLANHICDVSGHQHGVYRGEQQKFPFNLATLRETCSNHFVMQCFGRLFVVTLFFRGFQVHAFLQEVTTLLPGDVQAPAAKGYLEIVGKDGYPYSWNGQIFPIQASLMNIMTSGQCLTIHAGEVNINSEHGAHLCAMVTL